MNSDLIGNELSDLSSAELSELQKELEALVKQRPGKIDAQFKLAQVSLRQKDTKRAERLLLLICRLDSKHVGARKLLAQLYLSLNRPKDAGPLAAALMSLQPNDPQSMALLALSEIGVGQWEIGMQWCETALATSNDDPDILKTLSLNYIHCADTPRAEAWIEKLRRHFPDDPITYMAQASLDYKNGTLDAGIEGLKTALLKSPESKNVRLALGVRQLANGEIFEGWKNYAMRDYGREMFTEADPPRPTGLSELEGRSLFVMADQGIGDVIQFLRFLKPLVPIVSELHVNLRKPLHKLVHAAIPELHLHDKLSDRTEFDFLEMLSNLPVVLGHSSVKDLASSPYLVADPERVKRWKNEIGTHGLKIGICWQGNAQSIVDIGRSIPLSKLQPLAKIDGVRLISLQKGFGIEQIDDNPGMEIECLGETDTEPRGAFLDTVAIMENLDMVVTTDTSTAHVAGALGRPVLLLLKQVPDWRWLLGGCGDVWYQDLTLFFQQTAGKWEEPVEQVVTEILRRKAHAKPND